MTLTLYEHPFAAYCWKALIALYERDVPFEPRLVEGDAGRAEVVQLWAMGGIPVLAADAAPATIQESTTIVDYPAAFGHAPRLTPADPAAALQARLLDCVVDGLV